MSFLIRKLALYEKLNIEQEEAMKFGLTVTKPIDYNMRKNVNNILNQLNYSYFTQCVINLSG